MSIPKGERRQSKVEFDNTYFKVHDDATRLIDNNFGAKQTSEYIGRLWTLRKSLRYKLMIFLANSISATQIADLKTALGI